MDWFVYVVECEGGSLYCGTTTDVNRRVYEHNYLKKGSKYCKAHRPVKLIWSIKFANQSKACQFEYKFKCKSRKEKKRFLKLAASLHVAASFSTTHGRNILCQ